MIGLDNVGKTTTLESIKAAAGKIIHPVVPIRTYFAPPVARFSISFMLRATRLISRTYKPHVGIQCGCSERGRRERVFLGRFWSDDVEDDVVAILPRQRRNFICCRCERSRPFTGKRISIAKCNAARVSIAFVHERLFEDRLAVARSRFLW